MQTKLSVAILIGTLALSGCESRQAKVNRLQAEYDKLYAQYRSDCLVAGDAGAKSVNDAMLGSSSTTPQNPALTPDQKAKCKEEKAKLDPLADELLKVQQH